jgi:two-component system sensor histidine kinase and response regulator WspE
MLELFRADAEVQLQVLTSGLLVLERDPSSAQQLEACMRAAHSLKGAARIVGLDAAVEVAHVMEDCFVAAQKAEIMLRQSHVDLLLAGVDLLSRISQTAEAQIGEWAHAKRAVVGVVVSRLKSLLSADVEPGEELSLAPPAAAGDASETPGAPPAESPQRARTGEEGGDRVLRVTAENLNRLLGLAGESQVESRWLKPFAGSLLQLKRLQYDAGKKIEQLREALPAKPLDDRLQRTLGDAERLIHACHQLLAHHLVQLELYDSRSTDLAHRLYTQTLACRMRPFADGVQGFPRMVRDLGRSLGKQVRLEIIGEATQVDRDLLARLDASLTHLLNNAIDHGIESPEQRSAVGKPVEAVIRLEARHGAGMLQIDVSDDGRGIDLEALRAKVVARSLTTQEMAERLSESELLEFLFLPGFTLKDTVTEISGRGVGLDVVHNMLKQVRGTARVSSQPGKGTCFHLQLPLALSVVRTLLVEIAGEPYALPLAYIVRTLKLSRSSIEVLEGRQHFDLDGRRIGLVSAHQLLVGRDLENTDEQLSIVVVGDSGSEYGLAVERFIGETEVVVQPLEAQLGKIKDIAAGALMEDGAPVLLLDVDDLIRSIEKLVSTGHLNKLRRAAASAGGQRKRVLIVDDSLTVRELERKLLDHSGYEVEVAVDGMDGWNAVRASQFDLVLTDVDMPRMDGIELLTLIRKDPHLKALPVMIVSYKDREEDRRRGLEAGADCYLTKGSFHDETLIHAVADLIGGPQA